MKFPCTFAADLVSLLVVVYVFLRVGLRVGLNNKNDSSFEKPALVTGQGGVLIGYRKDCAELIILRLL